MKPFQSNAKWSSDLGIPNDVTTDGHDTKEAAEAVCEMLMLRGFGGDGVHFPASTWVTENPAQGTEIVIPTPKASCPNCGSAHPAVPCVECGCDPANNIEGEWVAPDFIPEYQDAPTIELDPDCSPNVDEQMTLQLRARCNEFAQALAGKVMAQLKRGEPVRVLDRNKNPLVWQHTMTIRHHVPRILAFLGLPEIDETEREMTLALHEMFAACGIIDPQRIEVLVIEERDRPAPALEGTVLPFTLEDAGN